MRHIQFDGNGAPKDEITQSGDIAILIQDGNVTIVRVHLLPPEEFGPELIHAENQADLHDCARSAISKIHPNLLKTENHSVVSCPATIASKAQFPGDYPEAP